MNAGNFLVLQQDATQGSQRGISPYREFTHTPTVLVRIQIIPDFLFDLLVVTRYTLDDPGLDYESDRDLEHAVPG